MRVPPRAVLLCLCVGLLLVTNFTMFPSRGALSDPMPHHHAGGGGSGAHHDHGGGDMDMDMTMQMWFEASWTVTLWFKSFHPTTPAAWAASALVLGVLGLAHEALASYRVALARQQQRQWGLAHAYAPFPGGGGGSGLGGDRAPLSARALHSTLYALNLATGYLLMLAVMTFNVGYFFVVVCSMGLGHLLFFSRPWHLAIARTESCCETASAAQS